MSLDSVRAFWNVAERNRRLREDVDTVLESRRANRALRAGAVVEIAQVHGFEFNSEELLRFLGSSCRGGERSRPRASALPRLLTAA